MYALLKNLESSFNNTATTFLLRLWKFLSSSPNKFMKLIVPKKVFFFEKFLWKFRKCFWQLSREHFAKSSKILLEVQKWRKMSWFFSKFLFLLKIFFRTRNSRFGNPAEK